MPSPDTQSKPLRERLLPQTSIRFFLVLIGASAVVMYTFRAAVVDDRFWAKILALLIATASGCFFAYAGLFLLANLLTATTAPLRHARVQWSARSDRSGKAADSNRGEN